MVNLFTLSSSCSTLLFPPKSKFHQRPHFQRKPIIISRIESRPRASTELDPSLSPEVKTFWKWLSDEGVVSAKTPARPAVVAEGLGLVAQRDISRNEVVLEIPKRLWINPDAVSASDLGGVCGGLKPWIAVALFLIREKFSDSSKWRTYIDILPETTNSTVFWSEEELAELQGTQLLSTTLGVKEYVQSEFKKVHEEVIIPNKLLFPSPITIVDFFWAFGILRSRAFSRLRNQSLVLIPLVDFINHNSKVTSEEHAWEVKGPAGLFSWDFVFSLRSPIPLKSGEQVFIQYDLHKTNAELALDYGFMDTLDDRHAFTLTLEISESDPFYADKLDIAESNGWAETAYFDIFLNSSLPDGMLPYLRLVALGGTDAFLLETIFRNSIRGHLELPVSEANEGLICRVVREACKSALSGYNTTIEQDEKLREEELSSRLEIAVGIRQGEKRVLKQIDGIFEQRELELKELEYYQERRLKDLGLCGEQGEIIFWEPK